MRPPQLQPLTRARVGTLGPAGQAWTRALPRLLSILERRWSIRIGRSLPGGSASYVAGADRADGTACVVKVALIAEGFADEAATLRRADGGGYVRLLDADLDRGALLLERLGPSLQHDARPVGEQLAVLADTLTLAWQPRDNAQPLDKAAELHRLVSTQWERLGRPCSTAVLDRALRFAEELVDVEPEDLVVVHGDPHPGNLLSVPSPRPGSDTGFCFVDPDGFVADRSYDLGVVLRDWSSRLRGDHPVRVLRGYADVLAARTGADPERIWAWGFLERVSTGLHVLSIGSPAVARPLLETAERLLG